MKKLCLLAFLVLTLSSCQGSSKDNKNYALFMYNYPRVTEELPSGNTARMENIMYTKEEITLGEKIAKPLDPERKNYDFKGWFKEKACNNEWNFEEDIANNNVILYAKWGIAKDGDYQEPEYVYPETIITDAAFRLTGILNIPIENGQVKLGTGAINRLNNAPSDVKFALNYERREDVTITSATFNESTMKINVTVSSNDSFEVTVIDNSIALKISENSTYETKAANYETKGTEYENYHIMLAGSSSMENWDTSTEDLMPIVSYNHGIGGTTVDQWESRLLERLVAPYSPKAVVYYVGVNNIINAGNNGEYTGHKLEALFDKTHTLLPNTQIFYVLINKLPYYMAKQADFDVANNMALEYEKTHSYLTCINAGKDLVKESGKPHWGYFLSDGLHMSKYGYVIWGAEVKKALMEWLG